MYRKSYKSKVLFENPYLFMWCSNQTNGADLVPPNGDWSTTAYKEAGGDEQALPTAIVIVEPRQKRAETPSNNNRTSPDWFRLSRAVDVNNDVMRLVSSLSTVVQILTRMTSVASRELVRHPEREEDFQGLRSLLNYADQMYTLLLQPQPYSANRPSPTTSNLNAPPNSLFHNLFDPMVIYLDRVDDPSGGSVSRPLGPPRVEDVAASEEFDAADSVSSGSSRDSDNIDAHGNRTGN